MAQMVQNGSEECSVAHKGGAWLTREQHGSDRVHRGSARVQCVSDGSALAFCKAGPSYNLGLAPHEGSAH
jgi:hypothetical protein